MQRVGNQLAIFSKTVSEIDQDHQKNCAKVLTDLDKLVHEAEKKRVPKIYKTTHKKYLNVIDKVKKAVFFKRKFLISYSDFYYKKMIDSLDIAIQKIEKSDLFN